ncbi:MAG: hypothetical protein GXP08_14505 [Gammaproteobacteria bacterium]|nr:hypothetical protein [Gammaproteobacteria bacterium]
MLHWQYNQMGGGMLSINNIFSLILFVVIVSGCGEDTFSSGDNPTNPTPIDKGPSLKPDSPVASVALQADITSLGSGKSNKVTLTAVVKDASHKLLKDEPVSFSGTGGALLIVQEKTTSGGQAEAILTAFGDPTNRTIQVTATAGTQSDSVDIVVVNTTVSVTVNGDSSAVLGEQKTLIFRLEDSDGDPIAFQPISISSENGNTLSASEVITNENGVADAIFTAVVSGLDHLRVSSMGATNGLGLALNVSPDNFSFLSPTEDDLEIGNSYPVLINWNRNGNPIEDGSSVKFSATRGVLVPVDGVVTTTNGTATVQISSVGAGPTLITASGIDGPSASIDKDFIAITPASLSFQAEKSTLGPGAQSVVITAVVRDANNNLVKNVPVRFSIIEDNSSGDISNATGITGSLGQAFTIYTSSAVTTAKDGVKIRAVVENDVTINATVALTVAEAELFVKLGTANKIQSLDDTRYLKEYNVLVTDSAGNAVPNKDVIVSVIPTFYIKGIRVDDGSGVYKAVDAVPPCKNEDNIVADTALNGILDPDEDINGNGTLEPRNVASVPVTVTTDDTGFGIIPIIYSKDFASWVIVKLAASVQVAGTESLDEVEFRLPVEAGDIKGDDSHPGDISPFGAGLTDCTGVT